jgi:hypothetical protein
MTRAESAGGRKRTLDAGRITATLEALERRISERFPESGLRQIARELLIIAGESNDRIALIRKPHWPVRLAVIMAITGLLAIVVVATATIRVTPTVAGISELAQGIEATINDIAYLGIALFFLFSMETRVKRKGALAALHELRSIVHIIDMHQLTKDPEQFLNRGERTASSPQRTMTRFELSRYLDYCSELLSLASKIAALYVQHLNDDVVLTAVNDVESLAGDLSAKIWQKIMILDVAAEGELRIEN